MGRVVGRQDSPGWLPAGGVVEVVCFDDTSLGHALVSELLDVPVTSVFAFLQDGDKLLLSLVAERGWDVPGGHVEEGELLEDALVREVLEECGGSCFSYRPFVYIKVTCSGEEPFDYDYPWPTSALLFYVGEAFVTDDDAELAGDVVATDWFSFSDAFGACHQRSWWPLFENLVAAEQ